MSDKKVDISIIPDNAITEILGKVYDDVAHKPLTQIGDATEALMKLVFLPFKCLGMTVEELEKKYKGFISKTINKVPKDKLVKPNPAIASQILERVKYVFDEDILTEMFSNLLASAMNIDSKMEIHPSFVNNIINMSPTDARIIQILSQQGRIYQSYVNFVYYIDDIPLDYEDTTTNYIKFCSAQESDISYTFLNSLNIVSIKERNIEFDLFKIEMTMYKDRPLPAYLSKFFDITIDACQMPKESMALKFNSSFIDIELTDNMLEALQKATKIQPDNFLISRKIVYLSQYGKLFAKYCVK